jgi:hypothetical protein
VTECYETSPEFPAVKRRKVEANLSIGDTTSNAGITLSLSKAPLHGEREGRLFRGYCDVYRFFPLYRFCGRHLRLS